MRECRHARVFLYDFKSPDKRRLGMIQIIGCELDRAMEELPIQAEKKFEAEPDFLGVSLQVWELNNEDFAFLCDIEPENWLEEHGWWVNGGCNHSKQDTTNYIVNGLTLKCFVKHDNWEHMENGNYHLEFDNLSQYLDEYISISKYNNVAYYIHSLAEINNMTKAELMKKYWQ